MKIVRTSETTISPRLIEELMLRRSLHYYNAERNLRKPIGIYHVSVSRIWDSFIEVLDELDQIQQEQVFRLQPPNPPYWDKKLLRRTEDLISRLC